MRCRFPRDVVGLHGAIADGLGGTHHHLRSCSCNTVRARYARQVAARSTWRMPSTYASSRHRPLDHPCVDMSGYLGAQTQRSARPSSAASHATSANQSGLSGRAGRVQVGGEAILQCERAQEQNSLPSPARGSPWTDTVRRRARGRDATRSFGLREPTAVRPSSIRAGERGEGGRPCQVLEDAPLDFRRGAVQQLAWRPAAAPKWRLAGPIVRPTGATPEDIEQYASMARIQRRQGTSLLASSHSAPLTLPMLSPSANQANPVNRKGRSRDGNALAVRQCRLRHRAWGN